MRRHEAAHALPISNGWSGHDGEVSVWCGYCRGEFTPDREWVERWARQRRRIVDSGLTTGYLSRGQASDARDAIAQDERWLLARIGVDA